MNKHSAHGVAEATVEKIKGWHGLRAPPSLPLSSSGACQTPRPFAPDISWGFREDVKRQLEYRAFMTQHKQLLKQISLSRYAAQHGYFGTPRSNFVYVTGLPKDKVNKFNSTFPSLALCVLRLRHRQTAKPLRFEARACRSRSEGHC